MTHRPRQCPYPYQHTPHEHTSGELPAQCDGRPDAPTEPEGLPPGMLLKLTNAISDVLDEHPEHNRNDEHEHVVNKVTTTALATLYGYTPHREAHSHALPPT